MRRRAVLFAIALVFGITLHGRAGVTYKVRLTANDGNRIVELPAEQYVAAVLAGESSTFQSDEALHAMAIAARTYAARLKGRHSSEGFDFCGTTHCQRVEVRNVSKRLTNAAGATAGELLWFEGKPAFSVYTRECGGTTEAVEAVWPDVQASYLASHPDPYCRRRESSPWGWDAQPQQILRALGGSRLQAPAALERVSVLRRTPSGRARVLELEGASSVAISAGSFRFAIGRELGWNTLRSDRYEVQSAGGMIHFRGTGQGHGVGLCQLGAEEMGAEGRTYREILAFYYPGTTVSRLATGFHWIHLGGEGVAVLTTRPDSDRRVLMLAEAARKQAENRVRLTAPSETTVRVYPDLDSFRNATGEPGWVAAHTSGATIDVQPLGATKAVLNHEMLHVVVESHAAADVPVWFREGVVEWLSNERPAASPAGDDVDHDLRQRQARDNAQRGYAQASVRVAALVSRYGESVVLGWIDRGLPAEVQKASASTQTTNSK